MAECDVAARQLAPFLALVAARQLAPLSQRSSPQSYYYYMDVDFWSGLNPTGSAGPDTLSEYTGVQDKTIPWHL